MTDRAYAIAGIAALVGFGLGLLTSSRVAPAVFDDISVVDTGFAPEFDSVTIVLDGEEICKCPDVSAEQAARWRDHLLLTCAGVDR